ncbi:hypothetical protein [Lentisalinibacter orientalis]|uniref:hypothetical protein n=1 Tax=Lentisalinibacter orientalis TaxID=2992241 RepID=UPI00386FC2A5
MEEDAPMQSPWLPAWLYRLLPVLYLAGGALMFHWFGDETIGRFSGLLLCAAGLLIWGLRLYVRRAAARRDP